MQTNIYSEKCFIQVRQERTQEHICRCRCTNTFSTTIPSNTQQVSKYFINKEKKRKEKSQTSIITSSSTSWSFSGFKNEESSLSAAAFKERQQAQHQLGLCLRQPKQLGAEHNSLKGKQIFS